MFRLVAAALFATAILAIMIKLNGELNSSHPVPLIESEAPLRVAGGRPKNDVDATTSRDDIDKEEFNLVIVGHRKNLLDPNIPGPKAMDLRLV